MQGFEKGYSRFACERELETKQNCNILTPTLMAVSVVSFSFSRAAQRRPRGPAICWMMAFFTASYQQLLWTPTQSGALRAPLAWCGFPYHNSSLSPTPTVWLLPWLSYIIVQRPLNRPLNLWNGMFDHHQAEITVMQFTVHSLLVHHSEVGPSPCPILSAKLTCAISSHNCHWNVSLPSGASLRMAFLARSKVKILQLNFFLLLLFIPFLLSIKVKMDGCDFCVILLWVQTQPLL